MSRRARLHAAPPPPKSLAARRKAARAGRLEVQEGFDGQPFVVFADELILIHESFLDNLPRGCELVDIDDGEDERLVISGTNRTVIYRLSDHDWDNQTYVGQRVPPALVGAQQ